MIDVHVSSDTKEVNLCSEDVSCFEMEMNPRGDDFYYVWLRGASQPNCYRGGFGAELFEAIHMAKEEARVRAANDSI